MANSRKKISELPALSVASLDTTFVLGISGSTTYKISINNLTSSLDGAFATDLVTNALSSSLNSKLSTSSFNSYTSSFTASVASGTISGSSQLTSSYDTRYTLSGSIPNIPTGSFATTGSNTFIGNQIISGSLQTNETQISLGFRAGNSTQGYGAIAIGANAATSSQGQNAVAIGIEAGEQSQGIYSVALGNGAGKIQQGQSSVSIGGSAGVQNQSPNAVAVGARAGAYQQGSGSIAIGYKAGEFYQPNNTIIIDANGGAAAFGLTQTGSFYVSPIRNASGTDGALQYNATTREVTYSDKFENKGTGIISGSQQISDLGFVTGSYTTINSFNSLTQSFNSISQSFNVISGSVGTIDFSTLATTGSNIFSGSQTISGGLSINNGGYSWSFESNGRTKIPNITFNSDRGTGMVGIKPAPGREFQIETSTAESSVGPWSFGLDGTLSAPVGANIIRVGNLVTTSSFNSYTASQSTSSLVDRLNTIESVSGSWITESETGSFLTSLSGAISSSAQITTFGFVSGSYETTGRGIISSSANLVTTSSYNADSASFDTRINSITVSSGSNLTYLLEAYANVTYTLPGGFTEDPCRYSVVSATENVPSNWFNTSTYTFTPLKAGYWEINAAYDVYRNTEASMAIRKNGSIVASAGSFNAVAQDISKIIYLNGSTDYIDIINTGGAALQRNQYQQRSWFQAKFVGVVSGSTDLLSANNTFTGTNVFSGSTTLRGAVNVGTGSGFEGGEINLAYAQTTSLTGNTLNFDVYQDRLRIFEGGGNNRGAYLNVASQSNSVGSEILTTTSTNILATPAWTSAGAITLTATTTNPTKGVTAQDNISYRQLGAKEWEIVMTYNQSANTGYVQGSGDYLITLPNGLSFDTTLPSQPIWTGNIGANSYAHFPNIISNAGGMITNLSVAGQIWPMVYSATKFRILSYTIGSGTLCWGSGFYSTIDIPKIQLSFRFTST